jgi:hypothetical protein
MSADRRNFLKVLQSSLGTLLDMWKVDETAGPIKPSAKVWRKTLCSKFS